jgi:asparagine synthase (glutamine-hydrolysing)
VRRYWDFDPGARVSHSSLEECDEHFREVFTRALRCRVPDDAPIGVFLSGGIDSSAIAGLAHAIGAPVHALTVAFRGSACDETPFSDAVIGKFGLAATRIDAAPPSPRAIALETHRSLDVPRYPNSLAADPLRDRAREMGIRMVLTGCGGDDFFAGASEPLRDVVRARGVVAGARALVGPLLSERARRRLRPLFGARANCPWIRPEFARRINLDERLRPLPAPPFPSREQQDLYRGATGLARVLGDEMEDRAAHATGVEQRHPFYDRRVAEFGFSLPSSERWNRGTHKVLLRRALARHLPAVVAARHDKAEFSPTFVEALEAIGGRPSFDRLRSEEAGWVDGVVVRRMYDDMIQLYRRGGDAYIAHTGPLWAVAALETWFERAEGIPR